MTDKKTTGLMLIPLTILWILGMIFAGKYDLQISLAIADPFSVYGRLLEIIGEPPAILFTSFNFSLITAYLMKKPVKRSGGYSVAALSVIGLYGAAFYTVNQTFVYIAEWRSDVSGVLTDGIPEMIAAVIITAFIGTAMLSFAFKLKYENLDKVINTAVSCVCAAVCTFAVIWCIKLLWGRVRFRQMDGDYSLFTPWFAPQGYTGFFSFPSGHTANAAVIFTSSYYLRFLTGKRRSFERTAYILLTVWIILLAFSRVRVGAHFLSDVLCGAALTFAVVYFFKPKKVEI